MNFVRWQVGCSVRSDMSVFQRPDFASVKALLEANHLPVSDLSDLDPDDYFGYGSPQDPKGFIGLEIFAYDGVLRSLVVDKQVRGVFSTPGYAQIKRCNAPDTIKYCREFSGLCSDGAVLMCKLM